jgi:exodeoxyribonuclease VII large subunit
VPVRLDLLGWLEGQGARLVHAQGQAIALRGQRLRDLARALPRPETLLDGARQRLDAWGERLPAALTRSVQIRRLRLSESAGALRPALLRRTVEGERRRLMATAARLNTHALGREIAQKRRDLDRLSLRFAEAAERDLATRRDRLSALDRLRETLGYRATLARGYAVVRAGGTLVTTRKAAEAAEALEIEFTDGVLALGEKPAAQSRPVARGKEPPKGQGSLF